ncbi:MAG: DNA-directed RNA polymerase subunit beta', partial [Kiritimatiellaeota bacterium]|nr:DNA-directed RNA polymerase subunit beta' [Kiritimatiellota bacterium]
YNADFDGDQMAVHVPLSIEAQIESRMLMLAPNNIFSPSSGKPITMPTQDITLGCYYMSIASQRDRLAQLQKKAGDKIEHLPIMATPSEVHTAFDEGAVRTHDRIRFRNPDYQRETRFGDKNKAVIETTVGRVFFNEIWPEGLGFFNKPATKKQLEQLILACYQIAGHEETVKALDRLKIIGFEHATLAGISIGMTDMIIPEAKTQEIEMAHRQIAEVRITTDGERYNKIVDIWTHATEKISTAMFSAMEFNEGRDFVNPLFIMVDSGARGSRQQIRQLAGMRGLMAKPSGEIIEQPIVSNFREGLTVLEYFISSHGARKGLADTALKTADSGYMTRKLVDVAQDMIIVEQDCRTLNGITVRSIYEGDDELVPLRARIIGRTALDDMFDPATKEVIVASGQEIDEKAAERIVAAEIDSARIRSVLTCESRRGTCARCYGRNLATQKPVALGVAVGIIAAQSIGEPGTQLTMRTFHIGGTASGVFKQPQIAAKHDGVIHYQDLRTVTTKDGSQIALNKNGVISIHDKDGRELEHHSIV